MNQDTRPVGWIRSAQKVFETFPESVGDRANTALTIAAEGGKACILKPFKGFGPGVMEIVIQVSWERLASDLFYITGWQPLGDTCIPEEIKNGNQDAKRGDYPCQEPLGSTEKRNDVMSNRDFELVKGSGNVFRDLGDPDADLKQAKAILATRIISILDEQHLSVTKASKLTHYPAADFNCVRNADLENFTLDRLMRLLGALDGSLRITLHFDTGTNEEAAHATLG